MTQQHLELLMAGLPESETKHLDLRFRELGIADQEACSVVETRAFTNPEHRCTPEKFKYRLTNCSAISYGLFVVLNPDHKGRLSKLDPVVLEKLTNQEDPASQKLALVAHAVSTLGTSPIVTDEDMAFPKNWRDAQPNGVGHKEHGRTVCLHSLAILPEFQGLGLGPLLMNAYLGFLNEARIADRVALLCEERLVPFYEKLGFEFLGPSSAQFGGGGWYDMVYDFKDTADAKATPS